MGLWIEGRGYSPDCLIQIFNPVDFGDAKSFVPDSIHGNSIVWEFRLVFVVIFAFVASQIY